ncbi:MAG: tryptophan 2,3-dioxygenase [Cyclobacteriaceae bacterium]|nr:tryptophan 2,3-dioxygenase [Cyclobacteriaceae bacterium]
MKDQTKKFTTIHYQKYLELDKILDAQKLRSIELEGKAAHDEMLFIVTHQVYELWFKQILHEIESVMDMFSKDDVDERNVGTAVHRLKRVIEIQKLLINQIGIIETMTPLDFLEFRNYLFPASGFQSFQFRLVESLLGLEDGSRLTYNNKPYENAFDEGQREMLKEIKNSNSLFDLVETWLERTPFLQFEGFEFIDHYKKAVEEMINKEEKLIKKSNYLSEDEKEMRLKMLGNTDSYYGIIIDENTHQNMKDEGKLRLSYNASVAALLISLYRDEPILNQPFQLLTCLVEIDELLTSWRYRHAQMVLRMLGKKIGTGGSSGYDYLHATAVKHHIFSDFHNISTLLIPRSELPDLPPEIRQELGFYYTK